MNTRTTLFLAVVLAGMVAAFAMKRTAPKPAESPVAPAPTMPGAAATRDLIEKKLGDVVKVVVQVKGKEAWTFEKQKPATEGATGTWRMTSPFDAPVASWEADKFGRELGRLSYEISYAPGEPGAVSPETAGLNPPEATITMTDADGATATVEIGKPAGDNATYVRLAGGDRVCVGKASLKSLWKSKALEYRDQQLWTFVPENVTKVEIEDRAATDGPVQYAFVRDGSKWMMTSPVAAKATGKVDDFLRSISRLRVTKWHDDAKDKLAVYGLDSAALSIKVTVEEKIPAKPAEPAKEGEEPKPEPPPEIKTSVHVLHVSTKSPIGEDTSTYLRVGDESAVATILKATTDKFRPVMTEWRDMKVLSADASTATRVEINIGGQKAAMTLTDANWSFEGGGRAESDTVSALLKAIKEMNAVVFVDAKPGDDATYGFSQPRAEIKLQIPGVEGGERLIIGHHTDETTKRMVYVRRGESGPVAKVRTTDVEQLLHAPSAYADRTILNVPGETIAKITLENTFTRGGDALVFAPAVGGWGLTAPVVAPIRTERMDKLVETLSNLRATAVTAEQGGFDKLKIEPTASVTVEESGEQPKQHKVSFGRRDGKFFARHGEDGPIGEIAADAHKVFIEEYRTAEVLTFDDKKVTHFSIRQGEQTHAFSKSGDKWTYAAEQDLPLDAKKADNLLLQLKDLKTERYARSAAKELGEFGLSAPAQEVIVTLDDGSKKSLLVSQHGMTQDGATGKYACLGDSKDVFLLAEDMLKRFEVNLAELEKK